MLKLWQSQNDEILNYYYDIKSQIYHLKMWIFYVIFFLILHINSDLAKHLFQYGLNWF